MKPIKINFTDLGTGWKLESTFFFPFLKKHFPVVLDPNPDYLIFFDFGNQHLKDQYHNAVKIFISGENIVPDFNICDYALGHHFIDFGDRYMRLPLFCIYPSFKDYAKRIIPSDDELLDRKFCNFLYSNSFNSDPTRKNLFQALSSYKRVDSGGQFLNNLSFQVKDKLGFLREYKFTLAIENSNVLGYTTEKLIDSAYCNSLPIYYGNPRVGEEFHKDAFVHVNDFKSMDDLVDYIQFLDRNDAEYLKKLKSPLLVPDNHPENWEKKLVEFFAHIFDQPLDSCKRKPDFGFNQKYVNELRLKSRMYDSLKRIFRIITLKD